MNDTITDIINLSFVDDMCNHYGCIHELASKTEKSWLLIEHGGGPGIHALEDASTIIEWRAILGHQLSGAARRIHLCHGVRLLTEKQATLKPTPGLHATAEMRALKVGMDSHW